MSRDFTPNTPVLATSGYTELRRAAAPAYS